MRQIKTLKQLQNVVKLNKILCSQKKSGGLTKISACFLMKQTGEALLRLFEKGLFVYEERI